MQDMVFLRLIGKSSTAQPNVRDREERHRRQLKPTYAGRKKKYISGALV